MKRFAIGAIVALLGLTGCGSDTNDSSGSTSGSTTGGNGGGNAACSSMAGTYKVAGACGSDTCTIMQTGCNTSLKCSGGSASYTGSVSGADFTYSGTSAQGVPATCTGTIVNGALAGTCKPAVGGSCNFTASAK